MIIYLYILRKQININISLLKTYYYIFFRPPKVSKKIFPYSVKF